MLQPGLVALLAEPVAEAVRREGLAEGRDEEGEVAGGRGVEHRLQFGQDRDGEGDGLAVAVLGLGQGDPSVLDVLRPEPDDVRPPLPGVEHERKRKPRLAAARVMLLELADLLHRPGVEPVALGLEVGHVAGRVALRQLVFDREGIDLPERLDEAVGGLGPVRHLVTHAADMTGLHQRVGLRSVLLADPVEDAAPDILGAAAQPLVLGRDIVLLAEPLEAALRSAPLERSGRRARCRAHHCSAIFGGEVLRPGLTAQPHLQVPGPPQVDAHVPVPVGILDDVLEANAARAVSHPECGHGTRCLSSAVSRPRDCGRSDLHQGSARKPGQVFSGPRRCGH